MEMLGAWEKEETLIAVERGAELARRDDGYHARRPMRRSLAEARSGSQGTDVSTSGRGSSTLLVVSA